MPKKSASSRDATGMATAPRAVTVKTARAVTVATVTTVRAATRPWADAPAAAPCAADLPPQRPAAR
jgi:hypothetical protein